MGTDMVDTVVPGDVFNDVDTSEIAGPGHTTVNVAFETCVYVDHAVFSNEECGASVATD